MLYPRRKYLGFVTIITKKNCIVWLLIYGNEGSDHCTKKYNNALILVFPFIHLLKKKITSIIYIIIVIKKISLIIYIILFSILIIHLSTENLTFDNTKR